MSKRDSRDAKIAVDFLMQRWGYPDKPLRWLRIGGLRRRSHIGYLNFRESAGSQSRLLNLLDTGSIPFRGGYLLVSVGKDLGQSRRVNIGG